MADEVEDVTEFHEWLAQHRHGALSDELGEAVAEVLLAVAATGKKGSVTMTLAIEAKGRSVLVVDKVDTKVPKPDREASIYFADAEGNLVRDDPVQTRMDFDAVTVERHNGETAEVQRGTGEVVDINRKAANGDEPKGD